MRHPIPGIANKATNIFSMGLLNTIGVLQAWVSEHQLNGYSESNIGWIFSAYAFFLYIGGAQVGEYQMYPIQYPHETYTQFKDQYSMPMTFDIYLYLAALALLQRLCVRVCLQVSNFKLQESRD